MRRWINAAKSYVKAVRRLRLVHSIPQLNLGLERQGALCDQLAQQPQVFKEHLDALRQDVATRSAESGNHLTTLQREVHEVKEHVRQHKQIDVVLLGDIKLFMYTDDASYRVIPDESRHYRLSRKDYPTGNRPPNREPQGELGSRQPARAEPGEPRGQDVVDGYLLGSPPENLTALLLRHYWVAGLEPNLIDVGASYGFESIYTGRYMRQHGKAGLVIAFEPGVAGDLLGHNVQLNGVADRIRVERAAIGNFTGPTLMFGERGHSENNRIVNRWLEGEDFSSIALVDALDAYVDRHGLHSDFIVKVDTQGGEPEVLEGMMGLLNRGTTTLITEFSPNALRSRVTPQAFLQSLAQHGTLFDLEQYGPLCTVPEAGLAQVMAAGFDRFTEEVLKRPCEWSDLLLVPFRLPRRDELLTALRGARSRA